MIGISACLGGICCRYDGSAKTIKELAELVKKGEAMLICPEVFGGLATPREPAEIIGGSGAEVWAGTARVCTVSGEDVTEAFKLGAIAAYKELETWGITCVVLKENSPSCGVQQIYDGHFSGVKKSGLGVAAAYFEKQGISIISENQWQRSAK